MAVRLTDKILPLNDAFEGLVDANQIVQTPGGFKDEDDMASDSNTAFCSQQSIKKYVDDNVGSGESGHATVAALIAATVTEGDITHTRGYLSEGDGGAMVYEVKTGLSASVDGGSVIDLGDSLYAEAKFFERVNPIMWGAKANDNATLVATANVTATNAMFDYIAVSMTTGGALPVKFPQGKFYVNDKIILPRERNVISILHDIDLNGCNIIGLVHSGGDNYPVIARLKSDIDDVYIGASDPEGVNITATRINIYNGSITGPNKNYVDRNDATKCLQLQCLYNPIVQNISFGTAGVCLSMQFCLNADVRNNLYGSFKYGLRLTSTKNYTGFSSTGSGKGQSNASTVFKDRFYCNDVTGTALEVSSSNMVTIQECIIEGGAILHAIHIIGNFDTTVNHIKINTLHLEVADSGTNEGVVGAGIRVSSWLGGDVYIEHIYYQYSGACFSKNRSAWTNTSGATDGDYREIEQSAGDITTDSTSGVNAIMGLTVAGGVITEWGLDGLSDTSTGFEAGDVLTIPAGVLGVGSTAATFTLRRRDLTETGVIKGGNPLVDVVGMTNAGRCHFNPVYWVPGTTLKHQWSQSQANATRWLFAGEAPAELVLKGGGGSGTYRINTSKFLPPLLYSNIDTVAGTFDTTAASYTFDSVSTPIWLAWRENTTDSTATSYYYNSDYPFYMMASNVGDSFGEIYKGSTTIQGANIKLAGFSSNGNIYGYVMATYNAVVLNAPYYCRVLSPRIRHERNTSDYVEFFYPAESSGGVSLYYPSEDGTLALITDIVNISNADLTMDAAHTLDLDGNSFEIKDGANPLFKVEPTKTQLWYAGAGTGSEVKIIQPAGASNDYVSLYVGDALTINRKGGSTPTIESGMGGFQFVQDYNGNTVTNTNPFNNGAGFGIRNTTAGSPCIFGLLTKGYMGVVNTSHDAPLSIGNVAGAQQSGEPPWAHAHSTHFRNNLNFTLRAGAEGSYSNGNQDVIGEYGTRIASLGGYSEGLQLSSFPNVEAGAAGVGFVATNGSNVIDASTNGGTVRSYVEAGQNIYIVDSMADSWGLTQAYTNEDTIHYHKVASVDHAAETITLNSNYTGTTGTVSAFIEDSVLVVRDWNRDSLMRIKADGSVALKNYTLPSEDGTVGQALTTDGAGALSFSTVGGGGDVVDDTTPQLGGDLDVNGNDIVSTGNDDIAINPSGTGSITLKTDNIYLEGAGLYTPASLHLKEAQGGGESSVGFKAPTSLTASQIWTLPDGDGSTGQALTTNGAGGLSFSSVGTGDAHLAGTETFTGAKTINSRVFAAPHSSNGSVCGDILKFGTSIVTGGKIYYLNANGTGGDCWTLTNATTAANSKGLLAVAMGSSTGTASFVGMCIKGRVNLNHDPGNTGNVLYLSETVAGYATDTAPSADNEVVRIIGYALDNSGNDVWFNPDNTYIEVAV